MDNEKDYYEPDIISVTDDNGDEILFELLERYENGGNTYVAITEYRDDAEEIVEADYEVLMKMVEEKFEVEYFDPEDTEQ